MLRVTQPCAAPEHRGRAPEGAPMQAFPQEGLDLLHAHPRPDATRVRLGDPLPGGGVSLSSRAGAASQREVQKRRGLAALPIGPDQGQGAQGTSCRR